jgi:hypothetical protein
VVKAAFEIADQQQAEVASRRPARSALVRVESLAQTLNESVEVVLIKNLIQSRVERVRGTARQVFGRHPHRRLLRVRFRLPIAIGDSVVRGLDRVDPLSLP